MDIGTSGLLRQPPSALPCTIATRQQAAYNEPTTSSHRDMNYNDQDCRQAAPGQPPKPYPPQSRFPYVQPAQPQVVIPVAPSGYQFWPNAVTRQPQPVSQQRHVSHEQQASVLLSQFQQQPRQQSRTQAPQPQHMLQQPPAYAQAYPYPPKQPSVSLQPVIIPPQRPPHVQHRAHNVNDRTSAQTQRPISNHIPHNSSTTSPAVSKPVSKSVITPDLPVDYRLLLLSLSDQYISQARGMASLITHNRPDADSEVYYRLISTGIICLETVLNKVRHWTVIIPTHD